MSDAVDPKVEQKTTDATKVVDAKVETVKAGDDILTAKKAAAAIPPDKALDDATKVIADDAAKKAAADKAIADAAAAKAAIPEKYEFKKPEKGSLHPDDETDVAAEAKALGLTADAAQKLYEHRASQIAAEIKADTELMARTQQQWKEELRNDPEFGGKGYEANVLNARKAIAQFDDKDGSLVKFLAAEGMQNNPTIAKALARIGKAMGEDKFITGAAPAANGKPGERTFEQAANSLYHTLAPKK